MPANYPQLAAWLAAQTEPTVPLTFAAIAALVGGDLLNAAYRSRHWWMTHEP
jgi:hypothetical protein